MQENTQPEASQGPRGTRSPLTTFLDKFGSIWFGVTCLFLIFVYSWIGSAGLAPFWNARESFVRQQFEKTEMAWFSWWPFAILLAVFCLALLTMTVRRIPFRKLNYGVWTVHLGILVMCLGCWIYFGTKIEGDAVVYRRDAIIKIDDVEVGRLRLQPRAETFVAGGDRKYQIGVSSTNPSYTLLTGDDKGKKAFTATVYIQPFEGTTASEAFMRQLIVGYPEYTEDVIPGKGRAVKETGKKLVDENIRFELEYAPVDRFHVKDSPALHVRMVGTEEWTEYPLPGLPRYKTSLASLDQVRYPPQERPPIRPIDLVPERKERTPELPADVTFRVTGYIPYALIKEFFEPGGGSWNPWMRARFRLGAQAPVAHEFLARDPSRSRVDLGDGVEAAFRWIDDPADLEELLNPGSPELHVEVPGAGFTETYPLRDMTRPIPLGESGYTLEYQEFFPNWSLASSGREGEPAAMVLVKVTGPERTFSRAVVYPDSSLSQDLDEAGQRHQELLDDGIKLELHNVVRPGLTLVSGAVGNYCLLTSRGGEVRYEKGEVGQPMSLLDGNVEITIEDVSQSSQRVIKPDIVAAREQNPKTLPNLSVIKLEIVEAGRTQTEWIEYSHYAHPNRIGFFPVTCRLQNGKRIEVVYGRETHPLPTPMALEEFQLEQFPGGTRERDYISLVRFREEGEWSEPHEVRSNQPTEYDRWWYFQSTWDPPAPQLNYAGMNYTGIGVGNRNGVSIMLLGTIMIVIGTLYAFYYKPVLMRRMIAEQKARAEARPAAVPRASAGKPSEEFAEASAGTPAEGSEA